MQGVRRLLQRRQSHLARGLRSWRPPPCLVPQPVEAELGGASSTLSCVSPPPLHVTGAGNGGGRAPAVDGDIRCVCVVWERVRREPWTLWLHELLPGGWKRRPGFWPTSGTLVFSRAASSAPAIENQDSSARRPDAASGGGRNTKPRASTRTPSARRAAGSDPGDEATPAAIHRLVQQLTKEESVRRFLAALTAPSPSQPKLSDTQVRELDAIMDGFVTQRSPSFRSDGEGEAVADGVSAPTDGGERRACASPAQGAEGSGSQRFYEDPAACPPVAADFSRMVRKGAPPQLMDALLELGPGEDANAILRPLYQAACRRVFKQRLRRYAELAKSADMRLPHTWYPLARAQQRRIVYHAGPTNSGKTHTALQALAAASSGVYCGPLRLLAMEVWDRLNVGGTYCSLVTGQERVHLPFAEHTACTIEMANVAHPVDVAVIDEIQMIGDTGRGWAWTRALLGLPASEIHLCGDASAVPVVRRLAAAMSETVEVVEYQRFSPLKQMRASLAGDLSKIEKGDCVISFSRRNIFSLKAEIERATPHRCCVIYGYLPPETRRQQAKLFNDPASGFDVLVASDAVGMGLNLHIRRVVFSAMEKTVSADPRPVPLPASHVKQIAGRAGRRGTEYAHGLVTTLHARDRTALRRALAQGLEPQAAAGLFPPYEQLERFAEQLNAKRMPFKMVLARFEAAAQLDGAYFFCHSEAFLRAAELLERVPSLTLRDRYIFALAPVGKDRESAAALVKYAREFARGGPVRVAAGLWRAKGKAWTNSTQPGEGVEPETDIAVTVDAETGLEGDAGLVEGGGDDNGDDDDGVDDIGDDGVAKREGEGKEVAANQEKANQEDVKEQATAEAAKGNALGGLKVLEVDHQILSLYQWLSYRFGRHYFPDRAQAATIASEITKQLHSRLLSERGDDST